MAPLLPSLAAHARSLLSTARIAARSTSNIPSSPSAALSQLGPLAARSILLGRDDAASDDSSGQTKADPTKGVVKPQDINNTAIFVVFGLIGAAFVCTGIWFFFWAKNGGFHFRDNDWEDYKSTVLRRKGPNGTLLSGATPSTQLGGGSVYKDVDDTATEYTGGLTQMTGVTADTGDTQSTLTGITAGASDIAGRERRRQKRERKEREREKKKDRKNREKSGKRRVGEDGVLVDEEAEAEAKDHLRAYRHEKPARVGGINKESEGSQWDGSTNPDNSTSAGSDLLSNRQSTPTNTPTKKEAKAAAATTAKSGGGIRKVYSTADRNESRENERLRREARREERAAAAAAGGSVRRDFSFQRARAHNPSTAASSSVRESTIEEESASAVGGGNNNNNNRYLPPPGGWVPSEAGESDVGTKAYRHVIPGLSPSTVSGSGSGSGDGSTVSATDYAEEKRKKRGSRYRKGDE
ncbi:hypothetical protein F4820DRAFT_185900 [Hypoxylon rubiginosum]|uniref:Uncharacterized protein n=1 Tax=Hypoxylon rubiginosum TaxID=110542 RepID=A0ACB9Z8T1_9PEZI|nr:hypothetical protein F4820DRAFT_185900 [Hypoxylon rubiginosum]